MSEAKVDAPAPIPVCWFVGGQNREWKGKTATVKSPCKDVVLGEYACMDESAALEAVDACSKAWAHGSGVWPQTPVEARIRIVKSIAAALAERRQQLADALMWEICKTAKDSMAEIDRTLQYINQTLQALTDMEQTELQTVGKVLVRKRRRPLGVTLIMGPMNYPFNETYAMLVPALLMGNCVVMKVPRVGGLVHHLTTDIFQRELPKGALNFITGSARETIPAVMRTGLVSVFSFIGGCRAANDLIKAHPEPHRLYSVLGLDAKNVAIVGETADLELAASQCCLGAFSFNGQRCTAIKMIYVHKQVLSAFLDKFVAQVEKMKVGMPWDNPMMTPLTGDKAKYILELTQDALQKGAKIVNKGGGERVGGQDSTLLNPTVVHPTTTDMRVCQEEQFGPICPVAGFTDVIEVLEYINNSKYGQQAAIFSKDPDEIASIVDPLVNQVARVNINSQCSRGPDTLPFTGRKSSALHTLSVEDALVTYSMEALAVTPVAHTELLRKAASSSEFLS